MDEIIEYPASEISPVHIGSMPKPKTINLALTVTLTFTLSKWLPAYPATS